MREDRDEAGRSGDASNQDFPLLSRASNKHCRKQDI